MRNFAGLAASTLSAVMLAGSIFIAPAIASAAGASTVEEGKAIAFDRKKGNCLACHMIAGGTAPGNIGPPLVAMKARFPDRKKLYDQIYDATKVNPESSMIPFGKYKVISEDEINKVIDFLYTL